MIFTHHTKNYSLSPSSSLYSHQWSPHPQEIIISRFFWGNLQLFVKKQMKKRPRCIPSTTNFPWMLKQIYNVNAQSIWKLWWGRTLTRDWKMQSLAVNFTIKRSNHFVALQLSNSSLNHLIYLFYFWIGSILCKHLFSHLIWSVYLFSFSRFSTS